jgi:hypothetical protein
VLITYFEVVLPLRFLPANRKWLDSDSERMYFGHNRLNPLLTLFIVVLTYPILAGTGFINNCLSSSGFVYWLVSFSRKALCSSF